jgi:1,4-alpha-glucan branching enzyme
LLKNEPALYENQFNASGFEWVDLQHREESVIAFRRKGHFPENDLLIVLNMTPLVRRDWKIYSYGKKNWTEIFNSDLKKYWGTGDVFNPHPELRLVDKNNHYIEINLHLPAFGAIVLK